MDVYCKCYKYMPCLLKLSHTQYVTIIWNAHLRYYIFGNIGTNLMNSLYIYLTYMHDKFQLIWNTNPSFDWVTRNFIKVEWPPFVEDTRCRSFTKPPFMDYKHIVDYITLGAHCNEFRVFNIHMYLTWQIHTYSK